MGAADDNTGFGGGGGYTGGARRDGRAAAKADPARVARATVDRSTVLITGLFLSRSSKASVSR